MNILQLIQKPQLRGAEVFACQLSDHINAAGHEAIVTALFPGDQQPQFGGKFLKLDRPFSKRHLDHEGWKQLAALIKKENPDVVQANAADTLKYAVFSKIFFRWKQPLVFRNASTVSLYIKSPLVKFYNSFLYRHVNRIISVSDFTKLDFIRMFPFCAGKTETIPIGIEEIALQKLKEYDQELINLVHVGGFSFEKNHRGLISIFKTISKERPEARLWLVGDGPLKTEIEELVRTEGLDQKVFFTGFVKNPADHIFSADVLLLPSVIEGLPGVVLEANYCKTPVVAYNAGGVSEIVKNNDTGWLIEKGDEAAFMKAVSEAIDNKQKADSFTSNAYGQVMKNYLNSAVARKFIDTYTKMIHAG